jgi:predicted AlkP superfamily phosphohydrolase/phosphomutase
MASGNDANILAIGVDAAEGTLVKQLIDRGEMPALKSVLAAESARWLSVESPAHIGSGTVWPTFTTGEDPSAHGIYSEWRWRPETMELERYHGRGLTPFWKPLAQQGVSLGIFDVPFALPVGVSKGFEVCEWWSHDSTGSGLQAAPAEMLSVVMQSPAHPLSLNRFVATTPDSQTDLKELTAACVEGVRLRAALAERLINETRPRLALLVFPELHHAGHQMWHTAEPENRVYNGCEVKSARNQNGGGATEPLLESIYRALDQQIAGLINAAGSSATVMVFALHGMRPALGFPAFLGPLLIERGYSRLAGWNSQTWSQRALSLFAATKRHTPEKIKQLYYKSVPSATTQKLAQPTMLPVYDWANTRAFSLPTDQYGWIRVNLAGRESQGIVPLDEYEAFCKQLEEMLLGLTTVDGELLVQDITRTASSAAAAFDNPLPDLVVHWRDVVFASPLQIKDSTVRAEFVGKKATGQHAFEGFCIYRGNTDRDLNGVVLAKNLGKLITRSLDIDSL